MSENRRDELVCEHGRSKCDECGFEVSTPTEYLAMIERGEANNMARAHAASGLRIAELEAEATELRGWLEVTTYCVVCRAAPDDWAALRYRCFDCKAVYCTTHFPTHFADEVRTMRDRVAELEAALGRVKDVAKPTTAFAQGSIEQQVWDNAMSHVQSAIGEKDAEPERARLLDAFQRAVVRVGVDAGFERIVECFH